MAEPIDEAFVEIKPDLKDFDRDVQRGLDRSFDKIEDKLDDLTDTIEKQFDRLIAALDANFASLEHIANDTFDEIRDFARGAGRSIATDIEAGTKVAKHEIDDLADDAHHDFNRIQRDARGSGFSIMGIFSKLGRGIANIFSDVSETVANLGSKIGSSLGSTIGQVGSSIGTVTGSIGSVAQIAMWGVLIPLALGLAGALSQLAGALAALPAAAGVAFAAILPLILAFHGFADAIGAVLEGDPDKINEALKKLSPSAAAVVKEFQKLIKPFGEIQKLAQESFFKPLVGTLTQLANAVLPALRTGVPVVAAAFGNMFAFMAKAFANLETTGVLDKLFASTARIINAMAPILGNLLEVVSNLFVDGLPYVERFFGVIGSGVQAFSHWLEQAEDGGKIVGWLEKAWNVGKLVFSIVKEIVVYFGTLLGSFADEGTDSLNGINDALKKMNEYLKSDDGKETLHNLGVIVHWAGNAFVWFLGTITTAWKGLNAFFDFVRGIGPFFSNLWDSIVSGAQAVGHWFEWLGTTIGHGFMVGVRAVGDFFVMIGNGFVTAYNAVVGFGAKIVAWFAALPGVIWNFITSIPTMMAQFGAFLYNGVLYAIGYITGLIVRFFLVDLPTWVRNAWNWVADYTMEGLARTWAAIQAFPGQVWGALTALWGYIVNAFTAAWDFAYNYTVEGISRTWANIVAFPGRVGGVLSRLGDAIGGWFSRAWKQASDATINGYHNVMNWINNIPGAVGRALSNAGSWLYNAGRDAIRGFVNGLADALHWAVDAAKHAAERIKQGFLDALHIGSPSKVMDKEVGRWVLPGVVQGMKHSEPELISYLNSLTDTFTNFGGKANTSIPNTRFGSGGYSQVTQGTPQVNVGGASIVAYLQIGDDQLQPVMVRTMHDNAQDVALAAQQGNTQLARRR